MTGDPRGPVLALTGGVGGAKLALGLYHVLAPGDLIVVCNTGDDFEHLGLHISPDIDTVMYTLAGLSSPRLGWGRRNETWNFMTSLAEMGGETWFQLGDRDLATHVERTRLLRNGETLSHITQEFASRLGTRARIFPMSDDPVRTIVTTDKGKLAFQHYFVRDQCRPRVIGFNYTESRHAEPIQAVARLLNTPQLRAIIICPSNPFLSIDPILSIPGLAEAVAASSAPTVAISPVVGGRAVKGPTAKIMRELGLTVSPATIANHYKRFIDGIVIDNADGDDSSGLDIPFLTTRTVMRTLRDKQRLARATLRFSDTLRTPRKLP